MKVKFNVTGMTCAACSARVEKVTKAVPGVSGAEVNLLAGKMVADVENEAAAELICKAVTDAGYGASVEDGRKKEAPKAPAEDALKEMKVRIIGSGVFLVILMYLTMGHMVGLPTPHIFHGLNNAALFALVQFLLTLPAVILNRAYFSKGLKALWHRSPNMDSLIAVGSGASLIYGVVALLRMTWAQGNGQWDVVELYSKNLYFESAAMILTLITLGKFLETRAKGKTGDAIRQLMDLAPKTALVRRDGVETEIPADQVRVGDTVIVKSGGRISVDGTVIEGRASVDQSALTGESVPVEKEIGDTVAAATILTNGYLELRADKVGEDTTLSQVIRLVEEAGGSKAPIARLADKIAGVFVPVVMTIAAIAFGVWMLAGQTLEFSLTTAIAVLVISCPCALGLATPVAIMVGTGQGAKMGVLFKNAEALENLHRGQTILLDKTGTLTTGKPQVTDVLPGDATEFVLLRTAVALEARSEHPFAKAILDYAKEKDISIREISGFETLPGRGVKGVYNGQTVYGGNGRLMEEIGVTVPEYPFLSTAGKTPLYFANESGKYLGAIAAADVLKDDSREAVERLKKLGLDVVMLTGDNEKTAKAIAKQAGIDHVIPDVLPGDKAGIVSGYQQKGQRVIMVGDGINDAPALATADVGIAIGAGTDIAIESADVVLMSGSLNQAASAVELSRATIKNIRENLFWAFFYNCLGIPIAAGALYPAFGLQLSPMLGAAAMSMSSVFVVSNALRLRLFKPSASSVAVEAAPAGETVIDENAPTTVIGVEGMMCHHCTAAVEKACMGVAGALAAKADLDGKKVTVRGEADRKALEEAIVEAGYTIRF
ncbi:MAG: heavy metal translocating P-type ATPase [Oscillospiraceae bacterium]|nr:heavy metal translocating P-type ATPase [Oscillospiraceae bacterium]